MTIENNLKTKKDYRDFNKVKQFLSIVENHYDFKEDTTIVDLCCGNGMLGFYFLEQHPESFVHFVDINKTNRFKELEENARSINYQFSQEDIYDLDSVPGEILLSIHACNSLTDRIIQLGLEQQKPFAVMTCCHQASLSEEYKKDLPGYIQNMLGLADYIDIGRAKKIRSSDRNCSLESISYKITPKNNIIISEVIKN